MWHEWAKIEYAHTRGEPYHPPEVREGYAGVLQCLATQEHPDFSAYSDPEVKWHSDKTYHAGMIVASADPARVEHLLTDYSVRFSRDFRPSCRRWINRRNRVAGVRKRGDE